MACRASRVGDRIEPTEGLDRRPRVPLGNFERILKDFDRDYWMDAKEAVAYGIVDTVVEKL